MQVPKTIRLLASSSFALFLAASMVVPTPAGAGGFSVELPAQRDNTLYEQAGGTLSNGAGEHLFIGRVGPGGGETLRRAILAFDVAGSLPADAVITGAQLSLEMSMTIVGETDVTLHRVLADWGEGASDASGEEGAGAASSTGDATWIHTFFDTSSWSSAGGDFDATASATTPVAAETSYTWGSTAMMVSDLQGWVDTPASEFGWVLLGDEVLPPPTAKRFDSRENATISNRPRLVVDFTSTSAVFLDNFESGDTTGWSVTVP